MDENKRDDFWSTKDDSFWKEPVIDDEWLNDEKDLDNEQATMNNPYASSSWEYAESMQQSQPGWSEKTQQTFEAGQYGTPYYQTSAQVYEQITEITVDKKKSSHAHLIIRLCFFLAAVVSVIFSAASVSMNEKMAVRTLQNTSCEVVEVEEGFAFGDNEFVSIDDVAYTIASEESFQGFPKDRKLIAVYADIESDTYIRERAMIREPYIGYEYYGKTVYKRASYVEHILPYLQTGKLQKEDILSIYGVGNGISSAGYYVFIVPKEVENVALHIEQNTEKSGIVVTQKIYRKEINVLDESAAEPEPVSAKEAD